MIIHSTCFTYKNGHGYINKEMYFLIIHTKYVHANVQKKREDNKTYLKNVITPV